MDRHDVPGATADDTARNHAADLKVAGQFGVEFFSYWHDSERELVFCFASAPRKEAMILAHKAAHGLGPADIIEVSESDVVGFRGRVHDPADASEVTSLSAPSVSPIWSVRPNSSIDSANLSTWCC